MRRGRPRGILVDRRIFFSLFRQMAFADDPRLSMTQSLNESRTILEVVSRSGC